MKSHYKNFYLPFINNIAVGCVIVHIKRKILFGGGGQKVLGFKKKPAYARYWNCL